VFAFRKRKTIDATKNSNKYIPLVSCHMVKLVRVWLGGVVVRASDLQSTGYGFKWRPRRRQAMALGKLFTHMCLCYQAVEVGAGVKARKVTADYGRDVVYRP